MTRNESTLDRTVRAVLAVVLAGLALTAGAGSALGVVLLVVAAVLLATAAVGYCPLYALLGVSTCPTPHRTRHGRNRVGAVH